MNRWAVLWDLSHEPDVPVGLVVEAPREVHVVAPKSLGVPSRFRGEYRVLQPDGSVVTYRPGMDGYFNQVLLELTRMFAIGRQGVAARPVAGHELYRLFTTEVVDRRRRLAAGEYDTSRSVPRHDGHHASEPQLPSYRPREDRRGRKAPNRVPLVAA
jgi:hypothetical protein